MGRMFLLTVLSVVLSLAARAQSARSVLRWEDMPPWPDAVGIGGPFAGVHEGVLIAGGGANFPIAPPWEGGAKVFSRLVYSMRPGDQTWTPCASLELATAYCASVETNGGLVLVGGSDDERVHASVVRLVWDATLQVPAVRHEHLPDLPTPTEHCVAGLIGDRIYVVPGVRSKTVGDLRSGFWCLDLAIPAAEQRWVELEPPPFAPRAKAVAAVQRDGFGTQSLYVFSGEVTTVTGGQPYYEYLADAWRFDPTSTAAASGVWSAVARPPRAVAAGSARAYGQSHVLVFSGSRGAEMHLPLAERTGFTDRILAYHTITDTWVEVGHMPVGVVTSAAATWNGDIVVVSGEVRPGVRTARVQRGITAPEPVDFGLINYAVLILYLLGVVWLGFYFSRRESSTDDYFLAGRRLPWWAAGLSIFGTMLSAITFLSVPALGFATNCVIAPSWLAILVLAPIVTTYYLPKFRRLNITTAYEYLEHRFGLGARMVGSIAFMLFQLGRMAVVVYLPALAMATFTGIDVYVCILVIGVLATVYTVLGGIEAVVWTDVVQVIVLLGGLTVALIVAVVDVGGIGATIDIASAAGKLEMWRWDGDFTALTTWTVVIGAFFLNFGPYTTDQATVQRYLTTRDERGARRGIWLNGLLSVPAGLLFFGLGIALFAWYQTNPEALAVGMKTDEVLPLFVSTRLPAGIAGLVIAGVFAASMSSLDSSMHGIATAFTTDFYRRFRPDAADSRCLAIARFVTVSMGVVGTLAAIWLATSGVVSLFFFFQKLLGLVTSGIAGIFFLGVFTRRSHQTGVLVGTAVSTAVVAWLTFGTEVHFYLYGAAGMSTCIVVGYTVSRMTPQVRTASSPA